MTSYRDTDQQITELTDSAIIKYLTRLNNNDHYDVEWSVGEESTPTIIRVDTVLENLRRLRKDMRPDQPAGRSRGTVKIADIRDYQNTLPRDPA